MRRYIEVISSSVKFDEVLKTWTTAMVDEPIRSRIQSPDIAREAAFQARAEGRCVIIRPNFNEPHLGAYSYREWRSFNGGLFTEIHFTIKEQCSMIRLDVEIVLPQPPSY